MNNWSDLKNIIDKDSLNRGKDRSSLNLQEIKIHRESQNSGDSKVKSESE